MRIKSNRFELIYSGGHHELYCDGVSHIRITSGTVGNAPLTDQYEPLRIENMSCSCGKPQPIPGVPERVN